MKSNDKKNGVAKLRERFYKIKKSIKISPELDEATRVKNPNEIKEKNSNQDNRKIALPKHDKDLDL
ncbi:MAG: hypothetical protein A2583_06740 [Bdellovibrionales bacterium RIFOXYD1_FULL_53_11]|nr:MAG: hypothetical protein A2583_06740 [Bdellovibrionales bacterium RIFOXYD1_FULL_53_11]